MCLLIFSFGFKLHPFILCSNRDETFQRETLNGRYDNNQEVYFPQDQVAGGTWIIISGKTNGRFAIILNFHTFRYGIFDYWKNPRNPRSRGIIPRLFIDSNEDITAASFANSILQQEDFQGYNLIIGDKESCYYISNCIQSPPLQLQPQTLYAISNGKIDDEWQKMLISKQRINEIIANQRVSNLEIARQLIEKLFEVMEDSTPLPDATYNTMIPELMKLSAINVSPFLHNGHPYGTRTITIAIALSSSLSSVGEAEKTTIEERNNQQSCNLIINEFNRLSSDSESRWEKNETIMPFTIYSQQLN